MSVMGKDADEAGSRNLGSLFEGAFETKEYATECMIEPDGTRHPLPKSLKKIYDKHLRASLDQCKERK